MLDNDRYYAEYASAFLRSRGEKATDRIHRFKRGSVLPRVQRAIGSLKSLGLRSLMDIGSGRGAALWPMMEALPEVRVIAVDRLLGRAADIHSVHLGGVDRLRSAQMDVEKLGFESNSVDAVTVLEVFEHLEDPQAGAAEVMRVTRRAVVASVPSKADDNPGHIHLFDQRSLETLLLDAGARRVSIDYVLNHMIAVAMV